MAVEHATKKSMVNYFRKRNQISPTAQDLCLVSCAAAVLLAAIGRLAATAWKVRENAFFGHEKWTMLLPDVTVHIANNALMKHKVYFYNV